MFRPPFPGRHWLGLSRPFGPTTGSGVAYEKQGESNKALDEYRKFLDTWKDADFHSVEIDDAKASVARLDKSGEKMKRGGAPGMFGIRFGPR